MISYDHPRGRFNFRVAGACLHDGHVLLQQAVGDAFWALPGGRVEMQEDTRSALRREMLEELGCEAEIGRLLWIVENFFPLSGNAYHEICFIYAISLPDGRLTDKLHTFEVPDGEDLIRFAWFDLKEVDPANLKPPFLIDALLEPPQATGHVVMREQSARDRAKRQRRSGP